MCKLETLTLAAGKFDSEIRERLHTSGRLRNDYILQQLGFYSVKPLLRAAAVIC